VGAVGLLGRGVSLASSGSYWGTGSWSASASATGSALTCKKFQRTDNTVYCEAENAKGITDNNCFYRGHCNHKEDAGSTVSYHRISDTLLSADVYNESPTGVEHPKGLGKEGHAL
jgi:hypothetical protein